MQAVAEDFAAAWRVFGDLSPAVQIVPSYSDPQYEKPPASGINDAVAGRMLNHLLSHLYLPNMVGNLETSEKPAGGWQRLSEESNLVVLCGPVANPLAKWLQESSGIEFRYTFREDGGTPRLFDNVQKSFVNCARDCNDLAFAQLRRTRTGKKVFWLAGNTRLGTFAAARIFLCKSTLIRLGNGIPTDGPEPRDFELLIGARGDKDELHSCWAIETPDLDPELAQIRIESRYDVNQFVSLPRGASVLTQDAAFLSAPSAFYTPLDRNWHSPAAVAYFEIASTRDNRPPLGCHASIPLDLTGVKRLETVLVDAATDSFLQEHNFELYVPLWSRDLNVPLIDCIAKYADAVPPRRLFIEVMDPESDQLSLENLRELRLLGAGLCYPIKGADLVFARIQHLRPERIKLKWFLSRVLEAKARSALVHCLHEYAQGSLAPLIIEEGVDRKPQLNCVNGSFVCGRLTRKFSHLCDLNSTH